MPVLIRHCNLGVNCAVTSTHITIILEKLPKPGDDNLGDSKFLGYFQLETQTPEIEIKIFSSKHTQTDNIMKLNNSAQTSLPKQNNCTQIFSPTIDSHTQTTIYKINNSTQTKIENIIEETVSDQSPAAEKEETEIRMESLKSIKNSFNQVSNHDEIDPYFTLSSLSEYSFDTENIENKKKKIPLEEI
ncbi:hypothetical protein TNCV_3454971 [Trichonephila clavipes]|nr:hypothetical protein TNCV_3454971 [Trichonephila clavipes]